MSTITCGRCGRVLPAKQINRHDWHCRQSESEIAARYPERARAHAAARVRRPDTRRRTKIMFDQTLYGQIVSDARACGVGVSEWIRRAAVAFLSGSRLGATPTGQSHVPQVESGGAGAGATWEAPTLPSKLAYDGETCPVCGAGADDGFKDQALLWRCGRCCYGGRVTTTPGVVMVTRRV